MKLFIALILFLPSTTGFGQSLKEVQRESKSIDSIQQIEKFKVQHPSWNMNVVEFDQSDSTLLIQFIDLELGGTSVVNKDGKKYFYKTVHRAFIKEYRASYIFLNGQSLDSNQIDSLQNLIIKKYNDGSSFAELAGQYSMDGNTKTGGDLGWVPAGLMVKEFETPLAHAAPHQIFTIDIPSSQWHYVVLKTHANRKKRKLAIVQIEVQLE